MAIEKLHVQEFLQMAMQYPLLDVRSPGEFAHAHIPGAYSLPLFSDEERKVVGTAYKQESREKAIKIGLKYFGVKMAAMVEAVEEIVAGKELQKIPGEKQIILLHCWRGGMRSAGVAWLLDLYGYKVCTLAGGYKAFRNWALQQFEKEYPLKVIGGYTGSGKTELLHALQQKRETVIDLECLANHKGSAFGNLGQPPQPSQEMFENILALKLNNACVSIQQSVDNSNNCIWIEDESQRIGNVNLPQNFYRNKQSAPVYFIDIDFEERLSYIVTGYGKFEKDKLVTAIMRIKKRLGGLETKTAINYLLEDDVRNAFAVLLKYYDKWYLKGLHQRESLEKLLKKIPCTNVNAKENAALVLEAE